MITLCNSQPLCGSPNRQQAISDAENLYNAGEGTWGTEESTFSKILTRKNHSQLRIIFEEYQQLTGHGIEEAIKNEFSGDMRNGLLSLVNSVKNEAKFFATKLEKSVKGLGTNDRDLIRIIVTRCEIDMGEIKKEYEKEFSESLAEAIKVNFGMV